ncbi:hypothetical protein L2E82_36059 [Cichorium intybus]|uniref:Uncharacterized protein n=1 Tax=Cichorium intybus TaxID=13427 RepID=A0ACB9BQL7_CICIN|nr:hypothetical protein L2E82_36059 [Cichorium intybus]
MDRGYGGIGPICGSGLGSTRLGGAFELNPLYDFSDAFVLLRSPPPLSSLLPSSLFSDSDTQRNHQFPCSRLILFEEGRHQQ